MSLHLSEVKHNLMNLHSCLNFIPSCILHVVCKLYLPNGHILVDSPSIRRENSTWKFGRNYIDFERRIHEEIMTSIRRGNFDVDLTFEIDVILMSFPRGFFEVVSTWNRRNFCTCCFH